MPVRNNKGHDMEVPRKIIVDFPKDSATHMPADYYERDSDEDDYDDDDDSILDRIQPEPTAKLMSPPKTLTATDITEEERRRFMRDASMSAANNGYLDDSMYKTPNDTAVLRNMNSFLTGDPVKLAKQVSHLHNRVKLIEEELQTYQSRQMFLFGLVSIYLLTSGVKMMFR